MSESKKTYLKFSQDNPDIPLFMRPEWLDVVCTEGVWDVVMHTNAAGHPVGILPYYMTSWYGLKSITMPVLTPFMGIWLDIPAELALREKYKREEAILSELIAHLPKNHLYEQRFHTGIGNVLPFFWNGFQQQTRYTFRFETLDTNKIYGGFSPKFRKNIEQAQAHSEIELSDDLELLYHSTQQVLLKRGKPGLFSFDTLSRIDAILKEKNQREILIARDEKGEVASIVYIVWDDKTSYYLLSGRSSGAKHYAYNALILWRAIQNAANRNQGFDFEGSMIPGVNRFFRNFGAEMCPYSSVFRFRSFARIKYLFRS